jgi:peroxiredoxin
MLRPTRETQMTLRLAHLLPAAALLFAIGCTETDKDEDEDEDETSDTDDGTDTDDDGTDGGTDGGGDLYGPDNAWPHALAADVPSDLAGDGWYAGDTAYNFTLKDQNGDDVELYQFHGMMVVLDVFAVWCGPCNDLAPEGEEVWQELQDRGVIYLALTQEDANGNAPTVETAEQWAATHGLTHPILADESASQGEYAVIGGGFPTFPVVGPDGIILTNDLFPPTVADVEALLDEHGM